MTNREFKDLERQVQVLNSKLDHANHKIDIAFPDNDPSYRTKVYSKLDDISAYLKRLYVIIEEGQLRSIHSRVDEVLKTVEHINRKLSND